VPEALDRRQQTLLQLSADLRIEARVRALGVPPLASGALGMKKDMMGRKEWAKPEVRRLGELKDVRAGTNPASANGSMS
jgi:hypothetical protein